VHQWKRGFCKRYLAITNPLLCCLLMFVSSGSAIKHCRPKFRRFRGIFTLQWFFGVASFYSASVFSSQHFQFQLWRGYLVYQFQTCRNQVVQMV
ncbi:hypothetical protein, partial [Aliivibrio fischeri]|uniref:hypothetical protein n=1 Tax=Aliivibrio fischeri TaxID=668 RepID=UPI001BE437AA